MGLEMNSVHHLSGRVADGDAISGARWHEGHWTCISSVREPRPKARPSTVSSNLR